MPNTLVSQEYRSPADILQKERERLNITSPHAPVAVSNGALIGTWVNVDHATRGLVRLMIAPNGNEITVHGFGACSPTPCDWGAVNGIVYADNVTSQNGLAFTAMYSFGFKQTIVVGHLSQGALMVETFDRFTDQSGRADYYSRDILSK